ncbi:MAG: acetolactate synthase small subunit [Clostridia bacterium]|nr:acetolactate synthase small subunit [Clostridia bacterium]
MTRQCLIAIVANTAGVLARISALFCQRGFNIDSLTVSATNDPAISRITIVTRGDERTFAELAKQADALPETKMIFSVEPEFSLLRELLLVKFQTSAETREEMISFLESIGGRIVDRSIGCIVAEYTGSPEETDRFIVRVSSYPVIELCRTGATALERGKVDYKI